MRALRIGNGRAFRVTCAISVFAIAVFVHPGLFAAGRASQMSEQDKIDALVHAVEMRSDLKFIRLGSVHSSAEAAQMLRTKLRFAGSRVQTVDDFIDHVATATASGSPYFVLYPDGKRVPSAEFLREELRRLAQSPTAKATQ
jgi:hypothetical protein